MAKLSPRITSFPKGTPREVKQQMLSKRATEIRELTRAELDEALSSGELPRNEYNSEINQRIYYEQLNPAQLDFDATYIAHAVIEKERREGKRAR